MRKLALLCVCVAASVLSGCASAWGGENPLLGTIVTPADGGTATNRSMCASNTSGASTGCGSLASFTIGGLAKLTVQCDEACLIATDVSGVDAGTGLALTAAQIFPTSTNASKALTVNAVNADAGAPIAVLASSYWGGWVAVAPVGATVCHCRVFARAGTE